MAIEAALHYSLKGTNPDSPRLPLSFAKFKSSASIRGLAIPNSTKLVLLRSPVSPKYRRFQVRAGKVDASADGVKWWQKGDEPNLKDIHSTQEFLHALSNAGDKLVVVEFYATWCGSCRALYPKLCQLAAEHPDVEFLKVNFDENKPMCKSLNVKFLPYFHFYRGAEGRLDSFSCSLSKLPKLKEAIAIHNTARCSIGPPLGLGEDIKLLELSTGSAV